MSGFICPKCKKELFSENGSYFCESGHSFDRAKSGYVNLLLSGGKVHGDDKEMVKARRDFLDKGYYRPLRDMLSGMAGELSLDKGCVCLDAGCGTGYYVSGVTDALDEPCVLGVDISKFAADTASKREKRGRFAVASVYELPVAEGCVDLILNVFSPMAEEEFSRVLKDGGYVLYAVPAQKHLFELKELLYDDPYENEESYPEYPHFVEEKRERVSFKMEFDHIPDLENLFRMTPYFWRTPKEGADKIKALDRFSLTADFYVILLRKK